ncbi:MAG: hypothetical protein PHF44_03455 [Candidatus Pacebacteria bacterium]|nr:hypothetical protein [Candidatus Paceibacterota bacterium]
MNIASDADGVVFISSLYNPNIKIPQWLFIFIIPIIILQIPDRKFVEFLRKRRIQGDTIIIISARPKFCFKLTRLLLRFRRVEFDELYCVGFGKGTKERKLKTCRDNSVVLYFDDDRRVVDFLNENSIRAIRYSRRENCVL